MMKTAAAVVLMTLAVVLGIRQWNAHLVALGDMQGAGRIQAAWDIDKANRAAAQKTAEAQASANQAEAERMARQAETAKTQEAERTAREQTQRENILRAAAAGADARNRSLLDTIARLNAAGGGDALPGASQDAGLAAGPGSAAVARDLLGQCSSRYTSLAATADALRNQVIGLQDFARQVCQSGATTSETQTAKP